MERSVYCLGLYVFGVHPNYPLRKSSIIFSVCALICLYILIALNIYWTGALECVESLISFPLVFIKYMSLIFKRDAVKNTLKMTYHFWKVEMRDDKITFFMRYLTQGKKYHTVLVAMGVLTYMIKPFILKNTSIFNSYLPSHIPYPLLFAVEFYSLMFLSFVYVSFNILICSLIISAAVQFRLLNLKIKSVDFSDVAENQLTMDKCINEIKHIIKYHQFLIRYVEGLNDILSMPIALLMTTSVSILCLNMYILSLKAVPQVDQILAGFISVALLMEFFMIYGLPAQLLMNEAEDTARMIYNEVNWYARNIVSLRKYLLMIMIRSQRGVCIRAGNYHIVNNQTILLMLKTAYSFYAFLQTLT